MVEYPNFNAISGSQGSKRFFFQFCLSILHLKVIFSYFHAQNKWKIKVSALKCWLPQKWKKNCLKLYFLCQNRLTFLTHLTWQIHTLCLPSNRNLDIFFALTGELGQVHMAKKIFPIFHHVGRWLFFLLNLWFSSKLVSKTN